MAMPNQVHEAARQILEYSSDIHGALALCGRHDLTRKIIKIQKRAAWIRRMERQEVNPLTGYRHDLLNGVGSLGHVISLATNELLEDISDNDLVTIIRMAEVVVRRGHVYLDAAVNCELERGYLHQSAGSSIKGDDNECA